VQQKAQVKLGQVTAKMRDLRALARMLKELIRTCRAGQPTDRCPILKNLEKERGMQAEGRTRR
jgi:MerR family mercuric resistance operon transcriptional regulator/MerR family gold-responsive transcriptional activator of gol and ges genes